ncbi:MAG: hypothetical protein IH941_09540 [Acidobacteria bacterium]|nr:hypothetical protein [Acidobacteriota bacterium]
MPRAFVATNTAGDDWSSWIRHAAASVKSFLFLAEGWDGQGAMPIDDEAADRAILFASALDRSRVERPFISPTNHGSIMFEWTDAPTQLFVEVLGTGLFATVRHRDSGECVEGRIEDIRTQFLSALDLLRS